MPFWSRDGEPYYVEYEAGVWIVSRWVWHGGALLRVPVMKLPA